MDKDLTIEDINKLIAENKMDSAFGSYQDNWYGLYGHRRCPCCDRCPHCGRPYGGSYYWYQPVMSWTAPTGAEPFGAAFS